MNISDLKLDLSERDNIILTHPDREGHMHAYLTVVGDLRLEVIYNDWDDPKLTVRTITISDNDLREYIINNFDNSWICRNNLGIKASDLRRDFSN